MAQPSIDEACRALATVVGSISGLRAKAYLDGQVNPDEAQVYERDFDPRFTFGDDKRIYRLGVRVMVSRADMRTAQVRMRAYREASGDKSVRAKIEDGDAWTETIDYAEVINIGQPYELQMVDTVGVTYWACDWDVDVNW